MISLKHILPLLVLILWFVSCKEPVKDIKYHFSDKAYSFKCENSQLDNKLLKEALYSFEDDIINYFDPKNKNINRAYAQFLLATNNNQYLHMRIITPHSRAVLERLKQEKPTLFKNGQLDVNNPIVTCVANTIEDADLKTTYNALLQAGSLKSSVLASGIMYESKKVLADKSLATYVALDMYYAKIAEKDTEKLEKDKND